LTIGTTQRGARYGVVKRLLRDRPALSLGKGPTDRTPDRGTVEQAELPGNPSADELNIARFIESRRGLEHGCNQRRDTTALSVRVVIRLSVGMVSADVWPRVDRVLGAVGNVMTIPIDSTQMCTRG
jgi:hypothetical protein